MNRFSRNRQGINHTPPSTHHHSQHHPCHHSKNHPHIIHTQSTSPFTTLATSPFTTLSTTPFTTPSAPPFISPFTSFSSLDFATFKLFSLLLYPSNLFFGSCRPLGVVPMLFVQCHSPMLFVFFFCPKPI